MIDDDGTAFLFSSICKKNLKITVVLTYDPCFTVNVDQWLDSAYEAIAKEAEIEAQMKAQQAAAKAVSVKRKPILSDAVLSRRTFP